MTDSRVAQPVLRPTQCPFCNGTRFDTLAKVINSMTCWRCRDCDGTGTIASQATGSSRLR
jgi:DnaJ-class molecular chaperone